MTQDETIELAIQGHASTRDAIRWAMNQEREACARVAENKRHAPHFVLTSMPSQNGTAVDIANLIRARGSV